MFRFLPSLPLAALLLAGCAMPPPPGGATLAAVRIDSALVERLRQIPGPASDLRGLVGPATPYAIGAGDVLSIVVWGHPELVSAQLGAGAALLSPADQAAAAATPPPGFLVSEDGELSFPYAGQVHVAGLSESAASALLTERLARLLNQPRVTLRVQYFRSQRIYVGGEVRQPGLQPINDLPMTLVEALNRAGGVLPTGDQSHLTVTRAGQRFRIDLPALIAAGQDPARLILRHGDVLHVAAADENKVFVAGEVVTPRALVMHNGRLTLSEALGEVGGVNPVTADASQVYVVRRAGQTPELYRLDAAAPGALAVAEGFELQPRDVVFVAPSGLANWHRALSQLIPGALPAAVSATKQ